MNTITRQFPVMLTALLAAAAVGTTACGPDVEERSPAQLEPVKVELSEVQSITSSRPVEVRGLVQPVRRAFVSSRVSGPVVALHVASGDVVRQGDPLLDIQPQAIEGQVSQAAGAKAQAAAALALAERNFHRYEALHADKAVSDLELDMARKQYEEAQGAVKQAEGALSAANAIADEAVVKAPFAARVVETLVEVGDLAGPGRPLVRVESLKGRQLWLTVPEADIDRFSAGDTVRVRLDSRPDLGTLEGTVDEIVPAADPATHSFTVKVGLGQLDVAPGLAGRAEVAGGEVEMLLIPSSAVHQRGGLDLVVVRAADGTSRTRAVSLGQRMADGRVEVLAGLDAGEKVAVDIPGPVVDGTPLEVAS